MWAFITTESDDLNPEPDTTLCSLDQILVQATKSVPRLCIHVIQEGVARAQVSPQYPSDH